jgi:hypothetical protein
MSFGSNLIVAMNCLVLFAGCAGVPVRGTVGGQTIATRVDSEIAAYYLSNYFAGRRENALLDERIDRVYGRAHDELPGRAELKRLSDEFSVDFAALYLADRIARAPANRRFRAAFDEALSSSRKALAERRAQLPAAAAQYEVIFVPGYLYKRHRLTGADFAAPRAALARVGFARHFVDTDEEGAIESNAELVAAIVAARAQTGRRLILVSASKSGPEVALALTNLGSAPTRHVAAWINIVGTLQGSPLADENLAQELQEVIGHVKVAGVESLMVERSRQRFGSFRLPEHVIVVNYIGIPLSGSISSLARSGYLDLRKYGPNDGLSLLSDLIVPGGVTLTELGRDHFLLDDDIDVRTVALAITLVKWLDNEQTMSCRTPAELTCNGARTDSSRSQ